MPSAGVPFLPTHWYYNTETGQLTQGNNFMNLGNNLLGGLGWHELNIPGNATAAQAAAEARKEFPDGTPPTTQGITPKRVIDNAANQATGNNKGSQGQGWHLAFGNTGGLLGRIIKVVLGGILLISGILRMTGTDKAALGAAGKAAVLA